MTPTLTHNEIVVMVMCFNVVIVITSVIGVSVNKPHIDKKCV